MRRSVFTSCSRLTHPSISRDESNPIKIRKTDENSPKSNIQSPAEKLPGKENVLAASEVSRKSVTPEKIAVKDIKEEIKSKLAVPKVDPVEEKENIEVSRKKTSFKVPVQTPRSASTSSSSHTPRAQQQQTTTRQTKTVQIKGKTYQILDKLGQGGFSKVYKCLDDHHGMCALKYVDLAKVSSHRRMESLSYHFFLRSTKTTWTASKTRSTTWKSSKESQT